MTNPSPITDEAMAEIKRLAEKATPGPYFVSGDDAEDAPDHAHSGLAMVDTGRQSDWPIARLCEWHSARYITALDPQAALALIARVEADAVTIRQQADVIAAAAQNLVAMDTAAKAQVQALQADLEKARVLLDRAEITEATNDELRKQLADEKLEHGILIDLLERLDYIVGKALRSFIEGNQNHARHHTISAAAVLFQRHKTIGLSPNGTGADVDTNPDHVRALQAANDSCEAERRKLDGALRAKDAAMGVLFERLAKAGVDCSDLIS
jgi:hypothetical protein